MTAARCPSCGRRKGRRACPALGQSICAACCGSKRRVEIQCPPDCVYLSSAQQHPPAVVQRRRERQGRFLATMIEGLSEGQYRLFLFVQLAVSAHAARTLPQPVDRDVADAAAALAATFETATRGIIYEHPAAGLQAQRLSADLKAAIDTLGREGSPPRDGDLAMVLRRSERAAREAEAEFGGERAYLELLGEVFPIGSDSASRPEGTAAPEGPSRLVLP